ncbi:hypothetical protein G9X43_04800 [Cronobacter turicensis]|uniref:hypothetical protein n=1 Tax=Cronobacter turicensis TaxID=413502 RepID=UPI0014120F8E|nr:hypothetical protein [Cronobacter turicensis]NHV08888.1 hypothetical protein [Cronobacter turicensis]NHV62226.1 hypothetical protein [Cronobacter turicensis]NHW09167.1 hypothetical protein [Cronobacter turicensis]
MKLIPMMMVFAGISCSIPVFASSDESWQALFSEMNKACVSAAGGKDVQTSKPILFPDETGMAGLLMKSKMPKMKYKVSLICLYDKAKKKAFVSEYEW